MLPCFSGIENPRFYATQKRQLYVTILLITNLLQNKSYAEDLDAFYRHNTDCKVGSPHPKTGRGIRMEHLTLESDSVAEGATILQTITGVITGFLTVMKASSTA